MHMQATASEVMQGETAVAVNRDPLHGSLHPVGVPHVWIRTARMGRGRCDRGEVSGGSVRDNRCAFVWKEAVGVGTAPPRLPRVSGGVSVPARSPTSLPARGEIPYSINLRIRCSPTRQPLLARRLPANDRHHGERWICRQRGNGRVPAHPAALRCPSAAIPTTVPLVRTTRSDRVNSPRPPIVSERVSMDQRGHRSAVRVAEEGFSAHLGSQRARPAIVSDGNKPSRSTVKK